MDENLIDRFLRRLHLVRASRYDRLYDCYRDVWRWWEKAGRERTDRT